MTPAQSRAARALLGWSQSDLAEHASLHKRTVAGFEAGEERARREATADALRSALEGAGVILIDANGEGEGVRLRKVQKRGKR